MHKLKWIKIEFWTIDILHLLYCGKTDFLIQTNNPLCNTYIIRVWMQHIFHHTRVICILQIFFFQKRFNGRRRTRFEQDKSAHDV